MNRETLMSVCSYKLPIQQKANLNCHNELSKSSVHYDWLREDTNANTNLIEKLHDRWPKRGERLYKHLNAAVRTTIRL